jgi:hypothetical protein
MEWCVLLGKAMEQSYLGEPWKVKEFAILEATRDPVWPILAKARHQHRL